MVESELPFKERATRYLMAISGHPVISNRQHVADLPSSWGPLSLLLRDCHLSRPDRLPLAAGPETGRSEGSGAYDLGGLLGGK